MPARDHRKNAEYAEENRVDEKAKNQCLDQLGQVVLRSPDEEQVQGYGSQEPRKEEHEHR
jgi:hypothetical protein